MDGGIMDSRSRTMGLQIIDSMLDDKVISPADLKKYQAIGENIYHPESIRREMEAWYITLGIEYLIGEKFSLSLPYFTESEIEEMYKNNEMILCVPKGVSREVLGKLFNFDSWALSDSLVTSKVESNDFWFKMKISLKPERLDSQGRELKIVYENEGKLQLSLERYMVFAARMRYLYKETPDTLTKTWIIHNRYEKKAMLIAGFDSNGKFSVQAWMPNFNSPYVGGRYVEIVDHHYI